jgi:RNA polymerase sigma-70 factor (ECF subfamily)
MRLIRLVQKRADKAAADTLIRNYYDEIYWYAYRQTADKHTALDLAQGIFVAMLKAISRFDGKQAGFRTWLYRIATNKIIDYHRSRSVIQNKILNLDDVEIPDESDFARQMEDGDLAFRIQAYAGTFEADAQRIFRLKIFGEYTFGEIAKMVDMPEATVKTKYYRMLKVIRKEFEDEYFTK